MIPLVPHVRAFAFSLMRRPWAEDLAQETLHKAWKARASYQPGTNLKSWLFTILRNQQMSDARRSWRIAPLDPMVAENTLVTNDDPLAAEELLDVRNAMLMLSFDQRQALALVGAAELSYKEAAEICGCPEGTVKSRVNRARTALLAILESKSRHKRGTSNIAASQAFGCIMEEAASMQAQPRSRA